MDTIDKATINKLHKELSNTLRQFAAEHGLKSIPFNVRYSEHSFTAKITFETIGQASAESNDKIVRAQLDMLAYFNPGEQYVTENRDYRIVGYDTRKPKKCWKLTRKRDNKEGFVAADDFIRLHFRKVA